VAAADNRVTSSQWKGRVRPTVRGKGTVKIAREERAFDHNDLQLPVGESDWAGREKEYGNNLTNRRSSPTVTSTKIKGEPPSNTKYPAKCTGRRSGQKNYGEGLN